MIDHTGMSMEEGGRILRAVALERPATVQRIRESSSDNCEKWHDATLVSAVILEGLDWLMNNSPLQALTTMSSAATLMAKFVERK